MAEWVYIVDDEPDILELVQLHLERAGFQTRTFTEGYSFLHALEAHPPSLVILDLMLPDLDGLEICKRIRTHPRYHDLPIIMLTARSDETDRVVGLELGADDYVVKPFSPKELVARVKAVLRRHQRAPDKTQRIRVGNLLEMDVQRYEVYVRGQKVHLTSTEFRILRLLAERPGWVYSRSQILDAVWGHDKEVTERTVDVHIRHLREKLGEAGKLIRNIRGVGYKIEA